MKKKILMLLAAVLVASSLTACGGIKMKCHFCDKVSSDMYINVNGNRAICKECAEEYWEPFDIKRYKLTNAQKKELKEKYNLE